MWIATVLGQEEYRVRTAEWRDGAEHRRLVELAVGTSEEVDRGWSASLTARFSSLQDAIWRAVEAVASSAGGPPEPECC